MPKYKKGDENKYFTTVIAALIIIAVAIATFVYSLLKSGPEDVGGILLENVDGVTTANPSGGLATPTSEPFVAPPTTPPPSN